MTDQSFHTREKLLGLPIEAVFTTAEAAAYCLMSSASWARLRKLMQTPPAIVLTGKSFGYRKHTLDAWLDARVEVRVAA